MSSLLILLLFLAVIVAIFYVIPIPERFRSFLGIVVVIALIIWLFRYAGLA